MKPSEVLRSAKALILDESNWTTGEYARDKMGASVEASSCRATKFCAYGAMERIREGSSDGAEAEFLFDACHQLFDKPPIPTNDELGHESVLKAYDRAIALAEAKEVQHEGNE